MDFRANGGGERKVNQGCPSPPYYSPAKAEKGAKMHYAISRRRSCKSGKSRSFLEMHFFATSFILVGNGGCLEAARLFTRYFSFSSYEGWVVLGKENALL